jgi:DMSO reductase family type II enzyme chaperone
MTTATRSNIYLYLSRIFVYPDTSYVNGIAEGKLQKGLAELVNALPYEVPDHGFLNTRFQIPDIDEFQSSYIRTFDVSPGGPPCPLYEGLYYFDRRKTMEELMRFYEHFGLKPDIQKNELPDHISIEMEFMHFLTFKEAIAEENREKQGTFLRAEHDFLERHPVKWMPELIKKLTALENMEFYSKLFQFVHEFLVADLKYVKELLRE